MLASQSSGSYPSRFRSRRGESSTTIKLAAFSLLAPDLINAEVGNIVWKKRVFQGLGADDAKTVIDEFRKLAIALTSTAELLADAYELAVIHRRSVYDSLIWR